MTPNRKLRLGTALMVTASGLALANPALARDILFSSKGDTALAIGERVSQVDGLRQIRLDNGAVVSVLGGADYRINADDSVDLYAGSLTVAGGDGTTVVRMPDGVEGRVAGRASAASFSVGADGAGRGHVLSGTASVGPADAPRRFGAGEMFAFVPGGRPERTVSNGAQATPDAETPTVAAMAEGGPVAAAQNGVPVTLGDALAAAGAASDILAAARRVDAAAANPAIETFPSGDLARLVAGAGGLAHAYGGTPFPAAQADIVRTYLAWLAGGGSRADFLTAYAGFLGDYLDLLRSGAAPSSFDAAGLADIHAFLAYADRSGRLADLGAGDRTLAAAYLAFLQDGGDPDLFTGRFVDLTRAYFAFVRGGGDPAAFTQASAETLGRYIAFLSDSGLAAQLAAADRALLQSYLANGGLAFAGQYRAALAALSAHLASGRPPSAYAAFDAETLEGWLQTLSDTGLLASVAGDQAQFYAAWLAWLKDGGAPDAFAGLPANVFAGYAAQLNGYFAWLAAGRLPSHYQGADLAQLQAQLAALKAAGALNRFLGAEADFFAAYLAFVQGGGQADAFAGLNANIFAGYAQALGAYYDYLADGGVPSAYAALSQAQIRAYLNALAAAGASGAFLDDLADFYTGYLAFVADGGNPDQYAGLPVPPDYPAFAAALNAYAAYLAGGGLPAAYDEQSLATLQAWLGAVAASGRLADLLGANADLLNGYFAYLADGGAPDGFSGLPVYADYVSALNAYYAFLAGGGLPADYTALTQAQVRAYLAALSGAGGLAAYAPLDDFFAPYYAFLAGGGDPAKYTGLPAYADYVSALNAYYAFLAGGGLPGGYTALTQEQVSAYLSALQAAGGLSAYANLNAFFNGYAAFLAGGGDPAKYSSLPIYGTYVSALNAYYAYLANGGLPAGYMALTPDQVSAYLAALQAAGGFSAHAGLNAFFGDYYAFLAGGGDPADYTGLPVYASWLSAVQAYYAFLADGGRPSDYTALTADQVETYLAALDRAGVLEGAVSGETLQFLIDYLAWLETGADPDQFAGLPINNGPPLADNPFSFPSGASGALAFATHAGVSMKASETPQLDETGALVDAGDLKMGTAQAVDVAGDESVVVGRYVDGSVYFRNGNTGASATGIPWVVVAPLAGPLPTTGTIDYEVLAATKPVFASGRAGPGSFDANLTIGFGPSNLSYGFDGMIVMPEESGDVRYDFASAGRDTGALVSMGGVSRDFNLTGTMTGAGGACASATCSIFFYGGFGGSEERVGLTYQTLDNTNWQTAERIQGAVAFGAVGTFDPGTDLDPDPDPIQNDGIAAPGAAGNYFLYAGPGGSGGATATAMTVTDGQLVEATSSRDSVTYTGNVDTTVEKGGDGGVIGWSRLTHVQADYRNSNGQSFVAQPWASQSWHSIWGTPVTDLPTSGLVNYDLVGFTRPTQTNAQAGSGSFAGRFAVDFATLKAGLDADVAFGGETYSFASTGGVEAPSMAIQDDGLGARRFSDRLETVTSDGAKVDRGTFVQGFLAGQGASHAGISYDIRVASSNKIQGTAAFAVPGATGDSGDSGGTDGDDGSTTPPPIAENPEPTFVTDNLFSADASLNSTYDAYTIHPINPSVTSNPDGNLGYEIDADGRIVGLRRLGTYGGYDRIGTATQADSGTSGGGTLQWTRWTGGTLDMVRNAGTGGKGSVTLSANQGYHIIAGTPATDLPTSGRVDYDLVGGTSPTQRGGAAAPGQLVSGAAAVLFNTEVKIGIELVFDYNSNRYTAKTAGGLANLSSSELSLNNGGFDGRGAFGNVTSTGSDCGTNCRVSWSGFLAGPGGQEMGVNYTVQHGTSVDTILGVAAFAAKPAVPTNPYADAPGALIAAAPDGGWDRWTPAAGTPSPAASVAAAPSAASAAPLDAAALRTKAEALLGGLVSFGVK